MLERSFVSSLTHSALICRQMTTFCWLTLSSPTRFGLSHLLRGSMIPHVVGHIPVGTMPRSREEKKAPFDHAQVRRAILCSILHLLVARRPDLTLSSVLAFHDALDNLRAVAVGGAPALAP